MPDTNIEYIVNGSGVKENIVVKSAQSSYEYNFEIAVKDVTLSLAEDGCIYAKDTTTGTTVFVMPKPFMLDANYEYSNKVSYSLSAKNKHKYEITISADSEWLNSSKRAFPVTIDPAIQTKQSRSAISSVYVISGSPNESRYSDPMIMVGKDSSGIGKSQGLIKFELPKINRGDVVIDAQLLSKQVLMDAYSDTTPDTAIEVHAITNSWNVTTVTWNTKPTYESTVADFEILKASEKNSGAKDRQWNVTSIVKRWYENPSFANNGLLLRSSNENKSSYNDSCIYMWVYGEKYAQSTAYPMLYITYRSNKGLESYWSYTDISAGRAGTASICEFSGNLVFTHNDVTTAGSRAPASISHVFNNYMAAENFGTVMPYRGKGWMLSCQQQLLPSSKVGLLADAQKTYPYVYIDGDGTEHYFYKKSDGTMVDEDGMGLTLTVPGKDKNGYYIVKDDKGNQMIFNVAGAFARLLDSNGNQIANYYAAADNPKIWKVTDGAGHAVTFTLPSDATRMNINIMSRDATGEAWFDGMQLEEGTSASPFNMINNSSFERYSQASNGAYLPQDWSGHLFDSGDSVHNTHQKDDGHSFRFNSVPTVEKSLIQTLYFKGKTAQNLDDTYILSGWVYANPVGGSNENNRVGLAIKIFYSDGTYYVRWFDYNNSVMGSQYVMGAFTLRDGSKPTANKTPTSMNVYLINFKQSNNSWFDNIQLVRDEAPSYTYNSDGKLVTVAANAKQKGTMEYSNGNLTKSVDAKGFNYSYKYDDNHNMTEATNQSGVKYAYVYDKMGNPTSLKVKVNDNYYIETGATYTANGAYVSQTSDQDGYTESYSYNDTRGTLTKYT
ncbi:MAG: DNRLRE domain-containing protein, partial [Ruminococcus sp.]|nr:DNRLRE domain-containing protein [Ruminococcus sp.]